MVGVNEVRGADLKLEKSTPRPVHVKQHTFMAWMGYKP